MRLRPCLIAVPFAALLAAACGGTTVGEGGGGACVTPTVGQACTAADIACQPADPCCAGYEWTCPPQNQNNAGTWQKSDVGCACQGPATPFSCGTTTCQPGEFCESATPGTAPPGGGGPYYTCRPIPPSCGPAPTCACVEASVAESNTIFCFMCSGDGAGHLSVHCAGA